jgi:hypothetical protein
MADPGVEYAWLVETSDDGDRWAQELHPKHGSRDSGGIETAASAEGLAQRVLAYRFAALREDTVYDWEELWFRVIVWDYGAVVDHTGWHEPPYRPERAGTSPQTYGRYLQTHRAQPHVVEIRTPRQVRNAVWSAADTPL